MTLTISVTAITPARRGARLVNPAAVVSQLDAELRGFAGDVLRDLKTYPPQIPRTGARQSLGIRAGNRLRKRAEIGYGYRRTGTYGRNWQIRRRVRGQEIVVGNPVDYGVFVGGPLNGRKGQRQARAMAARGWPSITTVGRKRWLPRSLRIRRILRRGGRP